MRGASPARSLAVSLGLGVCLAVGVAFATKPALRLERIDPGTFATDGTVRLFASLVELEGQVDDSKAARSFSLRIDGKRAIAPERVEPFRTAALPLDLVLVIESSALYGVQKLAPPTKSEPAPTPSPTKRRRGKHAPPPKFAPTPPTPSAPVIPAVAPGELPLDRVKDALATLLETRAAHTRVLVIDYGGEVTPHPPFRPAQATSGALDELSPDEESGDLRLVDAVRAALVELNRPRPDGATEAPPRRLIVVVSDGLNAQMDRKTFRALGDAAAMAHVPIHSIAFSPGDDRGPLLNLGEISKRSNGTFRWARNVDDLKAQIETLGDELDKQYVLTFALPIDKLEGHSFELACEALRSNRLRYDAGGSVFGYTGPTERRSRIWVVAGWLGVILAGLVVAYLLFAIALRVLGGRGRRGRSRAPASLLFLDGAQKGERFLLPADRALVLGKGGTVIIDDPAASTRHCELAFDGRGWLVTDLGSTNGTWLDGRRLDGPTYLAPGQILQLGQTRLQFLV